LPTLFFITISVLIAAPSAAEPAPKKVAAAGDLAMMDLQAMHGVGGSVAKVLNESFLVELKRWNCFASVVGGSDLRSMMDLEQQRQALGCGDESCLAELGGALGVPYFFHASLAKLGDEYILHAKLLSVDDAKVLARGMSTATTDDELVRLPEGVLKELLPKAFPGAVRTAPKVSAKQLRARRRHMLLGRAGLVIGLSGGLVAGWGYYDYFTTQSDYNQRPSGERTSSEYMGLKAAVERSNWLWGGGLSAAGLGTLMVLLR
jgi:hypothetical protein